MWNAVKTDLSAMLNLSKDALHIHAGLAIFVVLMLLVRRGPGSLIPWTGVLVLEALNELLDLSHWMDGNFMTDLAGSGRDFVNTMFWPTVIRLGARSRTNLRRRKGEGG